MVDRGSFGDSMRVGTLVKLVYWRADVVWIGVIIDTDSDRKVHRVAFIDSDIEWCLEDDLEILCK